MKRFFCFLLVIIGSLFAISCNKQVDLTMYISQLRVGIYQGETSGYKLTVYSEKREDPFCWDGYVGTTKNLLICKVESNKENLDDLSIEFNIDNKNYTRKFEFNPISAKYTSEIEVSSLITVPNLIGVINFNEEKVQINLNSKVVENTFSYKKALSSITSYDKTTVEKYFGSNKVNTEIHIRLLKDDNRNYYYVGFLNSEGGIAYLVDGLTGSVLAKKVLNNLNVWTRVIWTKILVYMLI